MAKSNSRYHLASRYIPWLIFSAYTIWRWRTDNIFVNVPAYGDVLEVPWGIEWFAAVVKGAHQAPYYLHPLTYYPEGWYINTFANGLGTFILLYPFYLAGGTALAYNAGAILATFVAFAGMFRLGQRYLNRLAAFVSALTFTFWSFRFIYHINVYIASALLPWMAVGLEKGWSSTDRRKYGWYVFAGFLWAIAISTSLYFIWIGGLFIIGWTVGYCFTGKKLWQPLLAGAGLTALSALVFSSPFIFWFWQGRAAANSTFFDIYHFNTWGSSLNSLPIPSLSHLWLKEIAKTLYTGPVNEGSLANLGITASVLVVVSLVFLRSRRRRFAPIFLVTVTGLVLAVGPFLKWNDKLLELEVVRPINALTWKIGHDLKPQIFVSDEPTTQYATAIPAPELFLVAVIPFWEGARVSSRYTLVASVGFFLLAAAVIDRLRGRWLSLALIGLLMIEVVPRPFYKQSVPIVDEVHPAYTWLSEQNLSGESIAETWAISPNVMSLNISAETLWATKYHQTPTVAGAGSVWPGHTVFLNEWLRGHPQPFQNPDLYHLLRSYDVHYLFLQLRGLHGATILDDTGKDNRFELVNCFKPLAAPSPWPYTICVYELAQTLPDSVGDDLFWRFGWSGREFWGIWGTDTSSLLEWVATNKDDHTLQVTAFPHCVAGQTQSVTIKANGHLLGRHEWSECEDWHGEFLIPGDIVEVGWNNLTFEYGYGLAPIELTGGANPDGRLLAVGFTQLIIGR